MGAAEVAIPKAEPFEVVPVGRIERLQVTIDIARIEQTALNRLGEPKFAEAARDGAQTDWTELVEVTLAS